MADLSKFDKPNAAVLDDPLSLGSVVGTFIPKYEDLPDKFKKRHENPHCQFATKWFMSGVDYFTLREDINLKVAMAQLSCCLRSFEPSHEEKIGGVGFLLERWGLVFPEADKPVKKTKHNKQGKPKGKKRGSNR